MNLPTLILASSSPRRAELLQQLCPEFRVLASSVPELQHDQFTACELAQFNAFRKAQAVAGRFPEALVIGADTLVYLGGQLFGKPADLPGARWMLNQLQGATHQVVTGVCLMHAQSGRRRVFSDSTDVRFKRLTGEEIDQYLERIDPLDKAGAYAIQEHGDRIVEQIVGSYSNVVGLPLERLKAELDGWGPKAGS
jgi:septum formation protein